MADLPNKEAVSVSSPPGSATVEHENQVDGVLQNYLDQLLIVATEAAPAEVSSIVTPPPTVVAEAVEHSTPPSFNNPILIDGEIQGWDTSGENTQSQCELAPTETLPVVAPEVTTTDVEAVKIDEPPVNLSQQLNWDSSQGVDCLIFKVAGLKLAIPLPLLGGVYTIEDKVTPLFGQAKWSLGVWQSDGQKLTVVDSAQLIMPERGVSLQEEGYRYLIQLDRAPWALACQEIYDTRDLVSESIKWRGDTSKRPWLAGTVISEMCALIDVSGLLSMLESQS